MPGWAPSISLRAFSFGGFSASASISCLAAPVYCHSAKRAFYGTGGFVTAYLLTSGTLSNVWLAMATGVAAATAFSVFVGLLALRRVGIYFAMITLAFGELSYFLENSPLSQWTGGENGLPGVPAPSIAIGGLDYSFAGSWPSYQLVAGFLFHRLRVRAFCRAVAGRLRADGDPPKS